MHSAVSHSYLQFSNASIRRNIPLLLYKVHIEIDTLRHFDPILMGGSIHNSLYKYKIEKEEEIGIINITCIASSLHALCDVNSFFFHAIAIFPLNGMLLKRKIQNIGTSIS